MNHLEDKCHWLRAPPAYVSLKHEDDKVIVFERADLLFVFNFHPTQSFADYRVGVEVPGEYHVALSSDEKRFGGFDRIDTSTKFFTTAMEWNGRKNWLQVRIFHWLLTVTDQTRGRRCISRLELRWSLPNGQGYPSYDASNRCCSIHTFNSLILRLNSIDCNFCV